MSFPSQFQTWAPWSNFLLEWFNRVSPENAELSRFWPTIGAQLLCLTVVLSPNIRRGLSHPWLLWLGKVSCPLYLLHGSFMRSLLSWLLFAGEHLVEFEERNRDESVIIMKYPLPGYTTFIMVMPVCSSSSCSERPIYGQRKSSRSSDSLLKKRRISCSESRSGLLHCSCDMIRGWLRALRFI